MFSILPWFCPLHRKWTVQKLAISCISKYITCNTLKLRPNPLARIRTFSKLLQSMCDHRIGTLVWQLLERFQFVNDLSYFLQANWFKLQTHLFSQECQFNWMTNSDWRFVSFLWVQILKSLKIFMEFVFLFLKCVHLMALHQWKWFLN